MRMRPISALVVSVSAGAMLTAQVPSPRPAEVPNFRPVTEDMLRNPAAQDWPNWRRTDNAWGYSPLTAIDAGNVRNLTLAWSWAMTGGANEATPLVANGVMYLPNPGGVVQALDAATGDLIWEYRPEPAAGTGQAAGEGGGAQRNIAIFGDKVYSATGDAHLIALDARTGKVAWDVKVADRQLGYQYTAGPIVVRGKVIAGITGCSRYKEDVCFITGHDAATGRELWRTSSIARPGEPGGDTWGELPLHFRAGGDMWIAGSYDPATNLVYWGTAQAKPWARAARGTDAAALFTSSTLALDPDTGAMKWYYQHLPGETQDMDEVFERILVDVDGRRSMFTMGKLGLLWQLDRVTGAFISARDIGYQNILDVDPRNGKVTYRPDRIPRLNVPMDMCPSTSGFKSWRSMAYSPQTGAMYIPLNLNCEKAVFGAPPERVIGRPAGNPVRRTNLVHPESNGFLGEFRGMDVRSGKATWQVRMATPMNTAALTTAGGLVFGGDWDRNFSAYDARTGRVLWKTRLPTSAQGYPISYAVNGRQYIAVPAGTGGASWSTQIAPELRPDIRRPVGGNSLLVFALPE
ncbi:MAG TPA: PQQ-binding-like beta-propeller repeat protein [Vicinamibacterales bacterium]|nr:PQQ-binding-like beta-propeller repeat protein [Vicinamibacterales bacterium]